MTQRPFLSNRSVLCIEGTDRYTFLQALITNDIHLLEKTQAIYTALLNAQGKYLADFFIIQPKGEASHQLLIDIEKSQLSSLIRLFTMYKLRSNVTFTDVSEIYKVAVFLDTTDCDQAIDQEFLVSSSIFYKDPRSSEMGWRFLIHYQDNDLIQECATFSKYQLYRLQQGIAEGSEELIPEKSIILEYGFDQLNAIAWNKGCYLGQELIARTKHRGMLQKRIFSIESNVDLPFKGTILKLDDQKIGSIIQQQGQYGIALLRYTESESVQDLQSRIDQSGNTFTVKTPKWWMKH